jgi:hypothetical protein
MKPFANLGQGHAGGNHLHHFVLPVRERLMQWLVCGLFEVGNEFFSEAALM